MARVSGVDIPREKRVEIALTYVFGIGRTLSQQTLAATGVEPSLRGVQELVRESGGTPESSVLGFGGIALFGNEGVKVGMPPSVTTGVPDGKEVILGLRPEAITDAGLADPQARAISQISADVTMVEPTGSWPCRRSGAPSRVSQAAPAAGGAAGTPGAGRRRGVRRGWGPSVPSPDPRRRVGGWRGGGGGGAEFGGGPEFGAGPAPGAGP